MPWSINRYNIISINFSRLETKNAVVGNAIESNSFQDSVPLSSSPAVSRNRVGFPRYCVVPHTRQLHAAQYNIKRCAYIHSNIMSPWW